MFFFYSWIWRELPPILFLYTSGNNHRMHHDPVIQSDVVCAVSVRVSKKYTGPFSAEEQLLYSDMQQAFI